MQDRVNANVAHADVPLGSVALTRIIEEVRSGGASMKAGAYNRTHNRHNR